MTDVSDETLAALRSLDVPDDLAQRHLARIEAARHENVVPLRPRRTAVRATAAGLVVGATLLSGAGVAAASTALPGDTLYGLKNAREHLQLSMTRHGESRARLELKLARTRLAEAAQLLRHGHSDRAVTALARADAALASAAAQGGTDVDAEVAGELDRRVEVLGGLLDGGLPEAASDTAREAIQRALTRGAHPRPDHPAQGGDGHGNKPDPLPTPTSVPDPHPTPSHPGPDDHPTGRPTAIPSHTH